MSQFTIETRDGKTQFRPGELIEGAAYWKLDAAPKKIEVRLFWRTLGKGTEDVGVADIYPFPNPYREEARPFQFTAPEAPYSFSGKLISLIWGLELVAEPGKDSARQEITIAPEGEEIVLVPLTNEGAR